MKNYIYLIVFVFSLFSCEQNIPDNDDFQGKEIVTISVLSLHDKYDKLINLFPDKNRSGYYYVHDHYSNACYGMYTKQSNNIAVLKYKCAYNDVFEIKFKFTTSRRGKYQARRNDILFETGTFSIVN